MFGRTSNVGFDPFSRYSGRTPLGRGAVGSWPLSRLRPAMRWPQLMWEGIGTGCGRPLVGCAAWVVLGLAFGWP